MTKKLSISLWLIIAIHLHSIRTEENIAKQAMNDKINKNILSGNNTKLNELSPQYNNELVAYNQLLPYLYSKLPIPVSLINQLQKYNINKNMLNKIYSYNKLRRELHSKLIENEINGYKYNDILSKKLLNLFKSVNQEEKKNFMNLINYLKMFNFDNNKLYNTLHDGNDLFKLINDNKIKYLPFINTDKNLPDLFINNKVNREIKKILIQYKISSMDLYNKLINKINPHLLEDTKKNNLIPETETMDNTKTEDTKANNPYELLKARIEDLASFRKRPHILPLNEEIPNKKNANDNGNILQKRDGRKIDESLNKYIKDLRLLNEIEKERADLVNSKIDTLLNPNNKNNVQKKAALLQPNPNAELLALYMVLSIPGLLSAIPSKNKRLPHIKKTAEDVPYIEAGQLYNKLSNKNWKVSLSKMHDIINSETYNKFGGLHMENKESKADIKMKYHPFGHQCSNLISNNDYYDAPQMNEYASEAININPVLNVKRKHIFAQDLYSALKSKNKLASALKSKNKLASKKLNNANGLENMKGNNILDVLSNVVPENKQTNQINYKIDGNKLFAQLQKIKNNVPNGNDILNRKIEGQALFDKLKAKACSDGWKEDTIYSKNNNGDSPNEAKYINGNVLFKLLKNKNVPIDAKSNKNGAIMDTEHQIGGQKLFKLLNPHVAEHKEEKVAADPKVNMNKFYEKLYQEFVKDNKGSINKLDNPNKNKVLWHHQNVEIPNISVDMADSNKNNVIKAENENIEWDDSNQGEYNLKDRLVNNLVTPQHTNSHGSYLGENRTSNAKRIRRSFDGCSSEYRERQATLDFVLNKIMDQFKITSPGSNFNRSTFIFILPKTESCIDITYTKKIPVGPTTDFMFSKDVDIDRDVLAKFYSSIATTTSKTTTPILTLGDIEKPKVLNKELLLLRIEHMKNAIPLDYSFNFLHSRIRNIIRKTPVNLSLHTTFLNKVNTSTSPLNQTEFSNEILENFEYTEMSNDPTTLETFRPYTTLCHRSSSKTQFKNNKKTMVEKRLRANMLPDIKKYHTPRMVYENNGTYIINLSDKDKIQVADYVDDLLSLYPNDPDILHKKFNKYQLEEQLRSYNEIFDELSAETKRKYYITLDIISRMDHRESVKMGGKVVISDPHEQTPSSDELKVLYDNFGSDDTDTRENTEKRSQILFK